MRYILALIIAVPLLAVSLEADAGLVEDLRSGKSNVKASSSSGASHTVYKLVQKQKSAADYKVVITSSGGWIYRLSGRNSAEQAVEAGLRHCKEHSHQVCRVFAVGDTIVQGHLQAELADAIEAYQLEVSGSKTTSKSTPADGNYCKTGVGKVYGPVGWFCGDFGDTKITKAEYDRLKNKKTVTARKTATSSHYCKRKDGVVYESKRHTCPRSHTQITKAEYDRLKGKKTDTATTSKSETEPSGDDPLEAKLEKLKKLLEKDLITEEEAAEKRAKLLEDM